MATAGFGRVSAAQGSGGAAGVGPGAALHPVHLLLNSRHQVSPATAATACSSHQSADPAHDHQPALGSIVEHVTASQTMLHASRS